MTYAPIHCTENVCYFSAWDDVGMQIAGKHLHSTQQAVIPSGSLGKGHPEFDLPVANICNMLFSCPGPSMCSVAWRRVNTPLTFFFFLILSTECPAMSTTMLPSSDCCLCTILKILDSTAHVPLVPMVCWGPAPCFGPYKGWWCLTVLVIVFVTLCFVGWGPINLYIHKSRINLELLVWCLNSPSWGGGTFLKL